MRTEVLDASGLLLLCLVVKLFRLSNLHSVIQAGKQEKFRAYCLHLF